MHDTITEHDSDGLASILAEYLTRLDRGETVCRDTFLAEHAQHADALRAYFADADAMELLAGDISNSWRGGQLPLAFGEYELLEEIGRGGMGIVYQAQELATGRSVALKMLPHGWLATPLSVRRFHNESKTAAALRHPNIMPVYRVGQHDGRMFYTMPLIRGQSLAERLAEGPLEPRSAAQLLLKIAEAIAAAHAAGIIHRDLKPANVLLDEESHPYVADFGLARRLEADQPGITMTGDLLGTPNYMAPEQVDGHHAQVGPAADVYALGAMLYAMLIGQPPFRSESVSDTLHRICTADPVRPRQHRRDLPHDLETVCLKCLEKTPAARYQSAGELAGDLRRFLAGEPLAARPVSHLERGRRWFARNPVVGSLVVGIALALIAGTAFSLHYARQATEREQQALANLYAADMNLAQQHLRSGAVASALRLLERHRPGLPLPGSAGRSHQNSPPLGGRQEGDRVRGADRSHQNSPPLGGEGLGEGGPWEWRHLWHQCHGELRQFIGPQAAVYSIAVSPDGRNLAAAGADHTVWVWDVATGSSKFRFRAHTASVRDVVFVPGKHQLISIGDDSVGLIWNTSTGERIAKLVGHEQPLTTVAASADGRFVATGGNNEAKVVIWDAATYDLRQSLDFGPAESLAFSPDSTCLAIAGRDGHVRLCQRDDQDSWSLTKTIPTAANVIHDIEWSPDGTRLAAAGEDGAVKLWDTKTWNEVGNLRLFRESVYDIEFSPNGRRLAAAIRNEAITIWDVDDPQHSTALTGHTSLVTGVRFCADGWRLLSASEDGSVRLWDAARPTDHDCLEGHRGPVRTIAYSPDGSTFASGGADGAVIVWNAETGHPRRIIRSLAGHLEDLAFSPDGSRLAAVEWNGHLRLWPIEPNKRLLDLNLGIGPLRAVAWSPDGRNVAVQALDGSIRLIDGMAGKLLGGWTSSRQPHGSITFDGTGEMLLTCDGDWIVRVWNAAAHTLRHELKGHTGSVVRAVYNPQGTLIASSSNDHTIRLWDAKSGRHLRSFTGHAGTPLGLAFNSDGTRLASSSTDHTVKLWDVATGMELQSLSGHTSWARDVAFSPNGRQLASAGSDGSIRIWHTRLTSDDNTLLEAIALVNDLSSAVSDRAALVATISRDLTVREAVRAAAIEQCKGRLLHWPDMIAAHRAAERHDWSAAIESFGRVTHLAPDDVMHWHWLAMANVAANRRESYQQCCEEMLRRFARNGDSHELYWTAGACLALPQQVDKLKPVRKLLDKLPSSIQPPLYSWLYDVRTDAGPLQLHEIVEQSKAVDFDEASWYGLAMVWYQAGDLNQSQAAYRNALNASRSGIQHWNWHAKVFRDALRREVAKLLASVPSTEKEPVADATPGTSRPSDTLSAGELPSAAPSAAQQ